jgi:hypothetical protein
MGNALNLWEIQAEVWATGKYPILSSYHSEEDLHKKFIIDKFLNDNNICLNNDQETTKPTSTSIQYVESA